MAEDKVEGEVRKTSSGSSVEEGHFSGGLDGQISTIEEQLQRAQATLFELQSLKGKLEAERQDNLLRARREQEQEEALNIKKENERLRRELHGYHDEIGSLKEIISSLKEDLVKTADKLEKKVSHTLQSLDEEDDRKHAHLHQSHSEERTHHNTHHVREKSEPGNFFSDHLEPKKPLEVEKAFFETPKLELVAEPPQENPTVDQQAPAAAPREEEKAQPQMAAESKAENAVAETQNTTPPATEAAAISPATPPAATSPEPEAAAPPASTAQEASPQAPAPSNQEGSVADKILQEEVATEEVKPVAITQINISDTSTAEDLIDDDFDEYEDIKKELEALENESIFKPVVQPEPVATEQPEPPKAKPSLFFGKKAKADQAELPEQKKLETTEQYKKHFWGKKEQPEANSSEAAPTSTQPETVQAATSAIEPAKDEEAKPLENTNSNVASSETTASSPAPEVPAAADQAQISAPTPEETAAVPKVAGTPKKEEEVSPIAKLSQVFKKRKKKVIGEVGDEHSEKRGAAVGKLVVRAAIFILVVAGAGLAYRISNANKLREMYTSKAQETVTQTKVQQAPDGFEQNPEDKYKEAYADAAFADTIWTNYKDPDLGVVLDYPQNTSYRLKPIGSNNLWFLRKNGYLLKIEKIETEQSLDQYMQGITSGVKYKVESANVRNRNTLHLVLEDDLPVKGNIYLVQMDQGIIYKIWYKTFAENEDPDDQQRVKKMLDTLDFISS